jgi:hypothetical protein
MQFHRSQGKQGLDKGVSEKIPRFFHCCSRKPASSVSGGDSQRFPFPGVAFDVFLVFCLFSLFAGSRTPEVNESHYLTKAKHFWDPSFGAGDMFLESGDAHWFFFATVGGLTHLFSLPLATWLGRLLGWLALAVGWCYWIRQIWPYWLAGALTAPLWLAALTWGHLSGEWVVGGCEAKVFAYASSLLGLAEIFRRRWSLAWIYFGTASAFHVLTGGWITLASLLSYLCLARPGPSQGVTSDSKTSPLARESPFRLLVGLCLGGCLALPGLLPALLLNRGVDIATAERGAMIYVYQRLAHHLSPMHFAAERWYHFAGLLLLVAATWQLHRSVRQGDASKPDQPLPQPPLRLPQPFLWIVAWVSIFALAGIAIDLGLSSWATNWSACLLRYYWFRWNDVIWPMLLVGLAAQLCARWTFPQAAIGWLPSMLLATLLAVPGIAILVERNLATRRSQLPPADHASLVFRHESTAAQQQVYQDWLDACYWIRANTPANALCLTPRFQQTFKWYAQRAEIASWKDAPQDTLHLIEWERRMLEIYPRDEAGYGIPMSDEHLRAMYRRYRMQYVVVDRRFQSSPPLLPLIYSNDTYAVFEFPELSAPAEAVSPP